jgi:hypothetical protein
MRGIRQAIHRSVTRAFWLGAVVWLVAGGASARTETIEWTHTLPDQVDVFRIFTSSTSGAQGTLVYEGVPAQQGGVFSQTIDVADGEDVFVVITARSVAGEESPPSNERRLDAPAPPADGDTLGMPGQPVLILP